jgi:SgrR family transcriptional regulator
MYNEIVISNHFYHKGKVQTSIKELSELLQCSERYTKTIVRQLEETGTIHWETARGRGKKPFIQVLQSPIELLKNDMETLWNRGKITEAFDYAKQFDLYDHPEIQAFIQQHLGVKQLGEEHIFRQQMYPVQLFLDPLRMLSRHDGHMAEQIHETLFTYEQNDIKPNLVFKFDTEDYKTWNFILRKGLYFHNGEMVTAKDAVTSIEHTLPYYKTIIAFDHAVTVNRYRFTVTLKEANRHFLAVLASHRMSIFPHTKNFEIGCGPFMLKEYLDERITLQVFPQYFKQRPWIDRVELFIEKEAFESPIHYEPLAEPSVKLQKKEEGATFIWLNSTRDALSCAKKRKALWHFINPSDFIFRKEEIEAFGWMHNSLKYEEEMTDFVLPKFKEPLIIGYQQIRATANHLECAFVLQEKLRNSGIECELVCFDLQNPSTLRYDEMDIYIGGNAMDENVLLSYIVLYRKMLHPLICQLQSPYKEEVAALLKEINTSDKPMELFNQLSMYLQQSSHLKFLKHRHYYTYIKKASNFKNISFDQNGRIDYKALCVVDGEETI